MDKKIRPKRQALGGFFMIPEISHSDISGITTKVPCEAAFMGERHARIEIAGFVMRTFVLSKKESDVTMYYSIKALFVQS